eukprot:211054-Chlamydomonas_euryale.AAC.2
MRPRLVWPRAEIAVVPGSSTPSGNTRRPACTCMMPAPARPAPPRLPRAAHRPRRDGAGDPPLSELSMSASESAHAARDVPLGSSFSAPSAPPRVGEPTAAAAAAAAAASWRAGTRCLPRELMPRAMYGPCSVSSSPLSSSPSSSSASDTLLGPAAGFFTLSGPLSTASERCCVTVTSLSVASLSVAAGSGSKGGAAAADGCSAAAGDGCVAAAGDGCAVTAASGAGPSCRTLPAACRGTCGAAAAAPPLAAGLLGNALPLVPSLRAASSRARRASCSCSCCSAISSCSASSSSTSCSSASVRTARCGGIRRSRCICACCVTICVSARTPARTARASSAALAAAMVATTAARPRRVCICGAVPSRAAAAAVTAVLPRCERARASAALALDVEALPLLSTCCCCCRRVHICSLVAALPPGSSIAPGTPTAPLCPRGRPG